MSPSSCVYDRKMPLASYTSLRTIAAVCPSLAVAVPYPNPQPLGQIAERCYYPSSSKSTSLRERRSDSRLLSGGRDGAIKGEGRACGLTRRYTRQAFFASHKKKTTAQPPLQQVQPCARHIASFGRAHAITSPEAPCVAASTSSFVARCIGA